MLKFVNKDPPQKSLTMPGFMVEICGEQTLFFVFSTQSTTVSAVEIWFYQMSERFEMLTFRALNPSIIRSDQGLTFETSAFHIFHGRGNSTFINSFDKTKFSCFTLPSMQHYSFLRNQKFVVHGYRLNEGKQPIQGENIISPILVTILFKVLSSLSKG